MIWTMELPGWHPSPVNRLYGSGHWSGRCRLKAKDSDVLARAVLVYGVPRAEQPRKVRLHVVLGKGQRAADVDAYWKSLLDGLKHAGAIKDDSRQWVSIEQPTFSRGDAMGCFVTVEE